MPIPLGLEGLMAPIFLPGKEPLPPGMTEEDRANVMQAKKYQDYIASAMESCPGKTVMTGVGGMHPLYPLTLRFFDLVKVLPLVHSSL